MAKRQKRKAGAPRAVQAAQAAVKPNPCELKRSKRKFDVLGRKIKGDCKNVVKSREEALLKVQAVCGGVAGAWRRAWWAGARANTPLTGLLLLPRCLTTTTRSARTRF